jgi:AraC-like DNA-binding protein
MNTLPVLPLRLDVFAVFIFLGVIQGLFLASFFIFKKSEGSVSNKFLGLLVLGLATINFEIFLCYSRYIIKIIHLVDFSEPFNFCIGPAFYLYILSKTTISGRINPRQMLHLLPFVLYILYSVLFFIQTSEYKYNAFLSAYFPGKSHISSIKVIDPDPLFIKKFVNELMLVQLFIYLGMSFLVVYKTFKRKDLSFFSGSNKVLSWLRNCFLISLLFIIFIVCVKLIYKEDLGDHFSAFMNSLVIYSISIWIVKKSSFFSEGKWHQMKKYEKSSLSDEMKDRILLSLKQVMEDEKPFLENSFSLPFLAKIIKTSPHHLSQVLNDCLKKNFFEYTAGYRIKEAQRILLDSKYDQVMMEEIAEKVGYNSKSAFNKAFKKQIGLTPSEFRDKHSKK